MGYIADLLRTLEEQALRAGGRSIALMGNHEAEFLENPRNSKATSTGTDEQGIGPDLQAARELLRKAAQTLSLTQGSAN